jgi:hypothetical protein
MVITARKLEIQPSRKFRAKSPANMYTEHTRRMQNANPLYGQKKPALPRKKHDLYPLMQIKQMVDPLFDNFCNDMLMRGVMKKKTQYTRTNQFSTQPMLIIHPRPCTICGK